MCEKKRDRRSKGDTWQSNDEVTEQIEKMKDDYSKLNGFRDNER